MFPCPTPSTATQEARLEPRRQFHACRSPAAAAGLAAHPAAPRTARQSRLDVPQHPTAPRPARTEHPRRLHVQPVPGADLQLREAGPSNCGKRRRSARDAAGPPHADPPPPLRRFRHSPRRCSANTGTRTASNAGGPALAAGRKRMRLRGGRAGAALSSARNGRIIRDGAACVYLRGGPGAPLTAQQPRLHRIPHAVPRHSRRFVHREQPRRNRRHPAPPRPAPPLPGLRHAARGGGAGRAAAGGARRSG